MTKNRLRVMKRILPQKMQLPKEKKFLPTRNTRFFLTEKSPVHEPDFLFKNGFFDVPCTPYSTKDMLAFDGRASIAINEELAVDGPPRAAMDEEHHHEGSGWR